MRAGWSLKSWGVQALPSVQSPGLAQRLRTEIVELKSVAERNEHERRAAEKAQDLVLEDIDRVEKELIELQSLLFEKDAELQRVCEQLQSI